MPAGPWLGSTNMCPGGRRGVIWHGGNNKMAYRVAYELTYGPIPEGLSVCHHCDNGICVRPNHLFVGTQDDNQKDMVSKDRQAKGTDNGKARWTEEEINEMRRLASLGTYNQAQLAEIFHTTQSCISAIVHRQIWGHLQQEFAYKKPPKVGLKGSTHPTSRFTEADVLEMRRLAAEGKTRAAIAKQFNASQSTICDIVNRKQWKHI